jgi:hypothetical protein
MDNGKSVGSMQYAAERKNKLNIAVSRGAKHNEINRQSFFRSVVNRSIAKSHHLLP